MATTTMNAMRGTKAHVPLLYEPKPKHTTITRNMFRKYNFEKCSFEFIEKLNLIMINGTQTKCQIQCKARGKTFRERERDSAPLLTAKPLTWQSNAMQSNVCAEHGVYIRWECLIIWDKSQWHCHQHWVVSVSVSVCVVKW